ncbi:MAG: hypothetical protein KDA68_09495 [Planctomycetaceae bacterium]|nr:hypothetical protein [Planctomycetaceae bacterium]
MIPIQVRGATGSASILGMLDTGADITLLPAELLPLIGTSFDVERTVEINGVGGEPLIAHFANVELSLGYQEQLYRWTAQVGFLEGRTVALLGHAGFLNYFTATFNGNQKRVTLRVNKRFPGERTDQISAQQEN